MSIESLEQSEYDETETDEHDFSLKIDLGTNSVIQKRQAYTFFDLLGDFGGFNDAIIFLLSLPMSLYSSAMYS